jgi:hypothetical protein
MNYLSIFSPFKHARLKLFLQTMALAAGLLCSGASFANLLNGDFSSGFTGWEGELFDGATTSSLNPVTSSATGNFYVNLSGEAVVTNDDFNWSVALFQDFTVQSLLAPGNTLLLELDFSATVSGAFDDLVVAQLEDLSGSLSTLDISGGSVDITDWAGSSAEILFLVEDVDLTAGDFLTINNIRITQHAASVPEPGTSALFLSAGLALLARRRLFRP